MYSRLRFYDVARLPCALAALALASCDPVIPVAAPPEDAVVAEFDPGAAQPVVPRPNDLAISPTTGLIELDDAPEATEAEKEFNRYLRTLDGFPVESGATVTFSAPLDPATVNADSVRILDVTDVGGVKPFGGTSSITWNAEKQAIEIEGAWVKDRRYAIAVVGGDSGVSATNGLRVVGSTSFLLLRARGLLVRCDGAGQNCHPTTTLISGDDAAERAVRLERARSLLAPAFEHLARSGIEREEVVIAWTFATIGAPLVTFDPAAGVIPFPNDLLMEDGKVNLPILATDDAETADFKRALNELNGFSPTAHLITEISDVLGAADEPLDPASVTPDKFVLVNADAPTSDDEVIPVSAFCRSCDGQAVGSNEDDQVAFRPLVPMRSDRRYVALWLRGARQLGDGPKANVATPFGLARSRVPLAVEGKSQIESIDDATAAQVESLRLLMQPILEVADARGIPREEVLLGWSFSTQTTAEQMPGLARLPESTWQLTTAVTGGPSNVATRDFSPLATASAVSCQLGQCQDFHREIRLALEGSFTSGNALELLATTEGAFTPATLTSPRLEQLRFLLILPKSTPDPARIPVIIFQHGLTGYRANAALIANTFAKAGFATLAIDAPLHGDRSFCTSNSPCATGTCQNNRCPGGYRSTDPFGTPSISGDGFISTQDLFATRDHFRQQVIDLTQLIRVLKDHTNGIARINIDNPSTTAVERLDTSQVGYVGQSLGGIIGGLATATIPEIRASTLNVAGATPTDIILLANDPDFVAAKRVFDQTMMARGITPGSQRYEFFIDLARWAMDPADPQNYARHMIAEPMMDPATSLPMPAKKVFISWVEGDGVVPNFTTEQLIRSLTMFAPPPDFYDEIQYPGGDHVFLLNPFAPTLTIEAQTDAVNWIDAGLR